jgi:hypothetical protein
VGVALHAFQQIRGTNQVKDIRDMRKVMQTQHQYPYLVIKEGEIFRNMEKITLGWG